MTMRVMTRAAVSIVIALVLTLQILATFDLFPRLLSRPSYLFWPFLDYPMYRSPRYEASVIEHYRVLATTTEGGEVEVLPADVALNFRKFRDILITGIRTGDTSRVAPFAELYRSRTGREMVAVRVERDGHVLTRHGLERAAPVNVATMTFRRP
jgi:hypothetical protein